MGDIKAKLSMGGRRGKRGQKGKRKSQDPKGDADAAAAIRAVLEQRRGNPGASILRGSLGPPKTMNIGSSTLGRDAHG